MKKVILVMTIVAGFIACTEEQKSGYDLALDNARHFLRRELGPDSTSYEEGTWGKIEPRRLEFAESNLYRLYNDTLKLMETRVTLISDSITVTKIDAPDYIIMTRRRDNYQQALEDYRLREAEMRLQYERKPEYHGYWLFHEYKMNGEPIRVHILLGDTVKYTPSGLIYK